jgi:hypothetical protein
VRVGHEGELVVGTGEPGDGATSGQLRAMPPPPSLPWQPAQVAAYTPAPRSRPVVVVVASAVPAVLSLVPPSPQLPATKAIITVAMRTPSTLATLGNRLISQPPPRSPQTVWHRQGSCHRKRSMTRLPDQRLLVKRTDVTHTPTRVRAETMSVQIENGWVGRRGL